MSTICGLVSTFSLPLHPICLSISLPISGHSSFLLLRILTVLFFLYPIHPVSSTLIFYPHLRLLQKPNLSGRGLVKVMRNSTYKVGWKEWGTNPFCKDNNRMETYRKAIHTYSPENLLTKLIFANKM